MTVRDTPRPGHQPALDTTEQPCPRCHGIATQTWTLRRVDQPVPGLWVARVASSSCPRGCLDGVNPWVVTAAFPSRPVYPAPAASRVSYPDPAADRRRLRDDEDDTLGGT